MLSGDEGVRRLRREHGFQLPLHPLQVSGWLALISLSAGTFLFVIPALPLHLQPAALASLSAILLLHLAAHLSASLLDPAEPTLRKIPPGPVPELDRTKHAHVIEDGLCHLCSIQISGSRTKHCSACNKCVSTFDHHCKWLNHCIGGRNYAPFLMCVSTAVAAAVLVALLAIAELILHHIDPSWLSRSPFNESSSSEHSLLAPANDAAFLTVVAALGILAAITAGLLLHLCFFHMYISFLGLTTYEYIRQQRQTPPSIQPGTPEIQNHRCPSIRHRPINLHCDNRVGSQITAVFTCAVVEETCTDCAEPTPTPPPSTPEDCRICIMSSNNSISPEANHNHVQQTTQRKFKRRWNCCVSVPDSPDDPHPHSPSEPRCLMNLCKYKIRTKTNNALPAIEARSHRTHGHWSSAKIRVLFRVIGNLGNNRRRNRTPPTRSNQVSPLNSEMSNHPQIQTVSNIIPVPSYPNNVTERSNLTLPSLPPPQRRRMVSDIELADALSILQQQQQRAVGRRPIPQYRRRRRSTAHRPKTPTLSPIRESGLSNPASPSRQNCTMATIPDSCTRPF